MDFFKTNKMLFWCVVVLVIVNVVTLTTVWSKRTHPQPTAGSTESRDGQAIMEERLGLSEQQAGQIEQARNEHFQRTRKIHDDMHKIRMDVLHEMFAAEPDPHKMLEMLETLGQLQTQFEINLYDHFQEMKEICDPQQAEELRFMLIDLIERTRPRNPRHQDREPGRGMGPNHHGGFEPEHGEGFGPEHLPPPHRR